MYMLGSRSFHSFESTTRLVFDVIWYIQSDSTRLRTPCGWEAMCDVKGGVVKKRVSERVWEAQRVDFVEEVECRRIIVCGIHGRSGNTIGNLRS